MRIRRATADDAATLAALWEPFSREASFAPYPPLPFAESLAADHVALVAEDGASIAGTAYVNLGSPGFGFLFGVYVVPAARRRGVARALVRAAAEVVRASGRSHLVLSVDTPNTGARALYDTLGFTDAARMLRADVEDLLG